MPATTTIDRDQRQGLYALVRNHLTSIEDFWLAVVKLPPTQASHQTT